MIKPGTICMVRGVPKDQMGYDCNGKIVTAIGVMFGDIYKISPALVTKNKDTNQAMRLEASRECYLHPFKDPDAQPQTTKLKTLEPA